MLSVVFLRNDCVCMRRKFPMYKKEIRIQQENLYKINFPATTKKMTTVLYNKYHMYVTPKTISRQNQKNKHNTTTVWNSKYIVVCTTKTYFPPEQKTDTTAQLEKSSSSPREVSVFVSLSVCLSVRAKRGRVLIRKRKIFLY